MARFKKPIDYVNALRLSSDPEIRKLGESLHRQYLQWTQSLHLKDLLQFMQSIQDNKEITVFVKLVQEAVKQP